MSSFFSYHVYLRKQITFFFRSTGWISFKISWHKQFFLKMAERWGINIYFVWKTTVIPLSARGAFLVIICICETYQVLFFAHRTIFCKKCLRKQFNLQNGGALGYKYLCRMKDHCSPLECMSCFFSYNVSLRDKSRSSFSQHGEFRSRNPDISNFFSKWPKSWGINIYVVWKTPVVPLSVCRDLFVITCICETYQVLFFAPRTIFCKKCLRKQFILKNGGALGYKFYVVWKTTGIPLSVCLAFLVITCICVTNHVLLWLNRVNFFQEILT